MNLFKKILIYIKYINFNKINFKKKNYNSNNIILVEFNNFKSSSDKTSDQIDDTISNLQIARKYFSDITDKLDNVVNNLEDYNKNGRKFLY